jgi:hypothetical protein
VLHLLEHVPSSEFKIANKGLVGLHDVQKVLFKQLKQFEGHFVQLFIFKYY